MKANLVSNLGHKIKKTKKTQCVYNANHGCQNQCDVPILHWASC